MNLKRLIKEYFKDPRWTVVRWKRRTFKWAQRITNLRAIVWEETWLCRLETGSYSHLRICLLAVITLDCLRDEPSRRKGTGGVRCPPNFLVDHATGSPFCHELWFSDNQFLETHLISLEIIISEALSPLLTSEGRSPRRTVILNQVYSASQIKYRNLKTRVLKLPYSKDTEIQNTLILAIKNLKTP